MPFYCQGQGHHEDCRCPIGNREPREYNPFKRNGQPRLSYLRSKFQRGGWLVLTKVKLEHSISGTFVHGLVLDSPTTVVLGFPQQLQSDKTFVYSYRVTCQNYFIAELKILPADDPEADGTIFYGFTKCGTEIELLARVHSNHAANQRANETPTGHCLRATLPTRGQVDDHGQGRWLQPKI